MYQPLPLNMIAGAEITFVTASPQRIQLETGGSENFCLTSNR